MAESFFSTAAVIVSTVAKVKGQYAVAGAKIFSLNALFAGYDYVKSYVTNTSHTQEAIDFRTLGNIIDDWASRRARWAQNGKRDDGTSYTLERWVKEGQGYAEDAAWRAGLAWDSTFFADAYNSAVSLVQNLPGDLNKVVNPTEWPWYVQAGVAGVGLYYASQIWANFRGRK